MIYVVINMDIVDSRKIDNRHILQDKLKRYFNKLSKKYKDILVAPINITLGDEWQIVLKKPEESYKLITEIRLHLLKEGIKTYSGIGVGVLSTKIYKKSTEMDGEAFIYAREALNIAKNKGKKISSKYNRVYFNGKKLDIFSRFNAFQEVAISSDSQLNIPREITLNETINILIENNEVLLSKMTSKQLDAIELYKEYGSYNKIVEKKFISSKAVISQRLNAAEYYLFEKNNSLIRELLELYYLKIMENH